VRERAPLLVALALRLLLALVCDRVVADVQRYEKVATHVLDVSANPYTTERLYPYPPVFVVAEAGSLWLARHGLGSFAVLVKLPAIAADVSIVGLLLSWVGTRAGWLYALHPVALLITGAHGQFDALMLLPVLLALRWHGQGRLDRAALALAAAIAVKTFPVLLLPLFLLASPRESWMRFVALALAPLLLLLLPFALLDPGALLRELGAYGGVADLGWIAVVRGLRFLASGALARSEARFWANEVVVSKLLFLAADLGLLLALARGWLRLSLTQASLAVLLAFHVFYGALSVQYLLWLVPLGLLLSDRFAVASAAASTLALLGFYPFLAPGVLWPAGLDLVSRATAGTLWAWGVIAVQVVHAAWLRDLLRRRPSP
jgi:hypothetical protein